MRFAQILFTGAVFFILGCDLPAEDGLVTDRLSEPTSLDDSIDHEREAIAHDSHAIDTAIDETSDFSEAVADQAALEPGQAKEAGENSPIVDFRGSLWSFQAYNYPDRYVRHRDFLGYIEPISTAVDKSDASFNIVPGLASPDCISFQSQNYPNQYLRHQDFRIKLQQIDPTSQTSKEDATFCPKPGLANANAVSFESFNYPGQFLRHRNFELWISTDTGEPFKADATFWVVSPWVAR